VGKAGNIKGNLKGEYIFYQVFLSMGKTYVPVDGTTNTLKTIMATICQYSHHPYKRQTNHKKTTATASRAGAIGAAC